jgi:DNA repair protein RecO (recombination protein O)
MIETATGIILRTRPLTETSLIVHWLTPNFGRTSTAAKGARRPKSPFLGKLDLFYEADFTFNRSRRSDLHTLREVSLRETHPALRQNIRYLQHAGYCARLVEQVTETETPLHAVYELMRGLLDYLPKQPAQTHPALAAGARPHSEPREQGLGIFAFELKLLNELGLRPDLGKSHLTPGVKRIVTTLTTDWSAISPLRLSDAQLTELRQFLHGFLIFHLGKVPRGRGA